MTFNEKLTELRKAKGFSQEELGFRLNVTRQTVSKWETGQSTPEMDKLIALGRLFDISLDELAGYEKKEEKSGPAAFYRYSLHYEYKSKRTLFGLPLVHINIGSGIHKAKGIIAVGTIAKGFISLGALSMGLISFGALSLGFLSIGAAVLGIVAAGGFSAGLISFGGISVGFLAVGGLTFGKYAIGGYASASDIAMGGFARGHIAIGDTAIGEYVWENITDLTRADYAQIKEVILREYPNIWRWILNLFA
ncbi:MAG TPA: transcriptional regulator [Ruminococcaceae bacterium]|nr:transcriptional regulator [Oscillospiraceae bacterium]